MNAVNKLYRRLIPHLPDDLPVQSVQHLGRAERLVWSIVIGLTVVLLVVHAVVDAVFEAPTSMFVYEILRMMSAVFAAIGGLHLIRRRAAQTGRELEHLRRAEIEWARLEGAILAARTAAHRINNALSPVAGYAELLLVNEGIKGNSAALLYANQITEAAHSASQEIGKLQRIVRLEEDTTVQASGLPVLDLERSSAEHGQGYPLTEPMTVTAHG